MEMKHHSILRKPEFFCLLGVAFFLPMLEAPKNLFLTAYVALWFVRCFREGSYGGRWRIVDTVIAALWLSGLIGANFAGIHGAEWKGFGDVSRYLLLWCLSRSGYGKTQWLKLSVVLVASCLLTLGYGAWALYSGTTGRPHLELNSVGHVNHTGTYL